MLKMARFLIGFLILANAYLITGMAGDKDRYLIAEAPMMAAARKLGKHNDGCKIATALKSSSSPSESPKSEVKAEHLTEAGISGAGDGDSSVLKIDHHHHHHRWIDEPVVGGVVILGGLVAAFLATVFWYIRVTRRRNSDQPSSPTNLSILIPDKGRS